MKSTSFHKHLFSLWRFGLAVLWLFALSVRLSAAPSRLSWSFLLIFWAALLLIPIALQMLQKLIPQFSIPAQTPILHFLAAICLGISLFCAQGILAGILAMPYLFWCVWILLAQTNHLKSMLKNGLDCPAIAAIFAFLFLTIAAIWLIFNRLDIEPLGFSTWIVLLTAAHFHYAGFALTLNLALVMARFPKIRVAHYLALGVILGVFLTAIGITLTQVFENQLIETLAAVFMAVVALCVGVLFVFLGSSERGLVRFLWILGGLSLVVGMLLALGYALRPILPIQHLTIPAMQAIHGTLNALGFGTLMLFGWVVKTGLK